MPIPHQEMRRMIKRRMQGLAPRDRARVLREALAELPGYYSGPYGELRRWIEGQIVEATTRRGAEHHDAYFIARQGVAQVALVGAPASRPSSMSSPAGRCRWAAIRLPRSGPPRAWRSCTARPCSYWTSPGLIEGGDEGRGDGLAVLAQIRVTDGILLVEPADLVGMADADGVRKMVRAAVPGVP